MAIEIFWVSGSPYSWRVLLAAEVKGVPYESRIMSLSGGENKTPDYLAMNPRGRTPVLKDGDFVLTESIAIVVYLDSLGKKNPLFGTGPRDTARVLEATSQIVGDLEKAAVSFAEPILFGSRTAHSAEPMKRHAETLKVELQFLEGRVTAARYLCGETVSAADLCAFPLVMFVLRAAGKEIAKDIDLGLLPFADRYPHLAAWARRIEALPGFARTYPPHWRPSA